MAWFEREFIAVPETGKKQLVYKWPDVNIRRYSRAIVNADQTALFVKSGQVLGTLGPGRHRIDADELPVLGALMDTLTGGNYYRAELYFVSTREFAGIKFGGRLADIADPISEQIVTLRVFGEFALSVREAGQLITSLAGSTDLRDPAGIESWSADLLLKAMKVAVTQHVSQGQWPVLGLSGLLPVSSKRWCGRPIPRSTNTGYGYPARQFRHHSGPRRRRSAQTARRRCHLHQAAGDFRQYAAGEMALGAGQGLASGHGHEGGFLGAALGINAIGQSAPPAAGHFPPAPGSPWQQNQQPRQEQPATGLPPTAKPAELGPAASESPVCTACAAANPPGAKFCVECGNRFAPAEPPRCRECAAELLPTAKFCASCGTRSQHT